jgi:hypothetical protein
MPAFAGMTNLHFARNLPQGFSKRRRISTITKKRCQPNVDLSRIIEPFSAR